MSKKRVPDRSPCARLVPPEETTGRRYVVRLNGAPLSSHQFSPVSRTSEAGTANAAHLAVAFLSGAEIVDANRGASDVIGPGGHRTNLQPLVCRGSPRTR